MKIDKDKILNTNFYDDIDLDIYLEANSNFTYNISGINNKESNIRIYAYLKEGSNITINVDIINKSKLNIDIKSILDSDSTKAGSAENITVINLEGSSTSVRPNLDVANSNVYADHASYIGPFMDSSIFYLASRGLDYNTATNLLAKALLTRNNKDYNMELDNV